LRCYATDDGLGDPGYLDDQLNKTSNGSVFQGLLGPGASVRTVGAEITQETGDFFVSDAEGDPDKPTDGFSSIDQAITALREKVGEWLRYNILQTGTFHLCVLHDHFQSFISLYICSIVSRASVCIFISEFPSSWVLNLHDQELDVST
jgi:hypothetical protein